MTSPTAATMHDQQNHLIQQRCARESLGKSPLIVQWDEGSKRKKAWVVTTVVGQRSDGTRAREVSASAPHYCRLAHTLAPLPCLSLAAASI